MLKHIHLLLVFLVTATYLYRVYLAARQPEKLEQKHLKLAPHALAGLLLLSGVALTFQGDWFNIAYGWIIAKLLLMLVFVALGLVTIKSQGSLRWKAFAGSLVVLFLIAKIAVVKQVFFFV